MPTLDQAIALVRTWSPERQQEAADLLAALDELPAGTLELDDETLAGIDEGLADAAGRIADPAEVEAFFARHRK